MSDSQVYIPSSGDTFADTYYQGITILVNFYDSKEQQVSYWICYPWPSKTRQSFQCKLTSFHAYIKEGRLRPLLQKSLNLGPVINNDGRTRCCTCFAPTIEVADGESVIDACPYCELGSKR